MHEGTAWFEFKASIMGDVIRLDWPEGAPVIAVDQGIAKTMIMNHYAYNIDDQKMADYNAAVDAYLAAASQQSEPQQVPPPAPAPESVPAPVTQAAEPPPAPATEPPPPPPAEPEEQATGKKGK